MSSTKPVYSLPVSGGRATKESHDAEVNRVVDLLWPMSPDGPEGVLDEVNEAREDAEAAAARAEAAASRVWVAALHGVIPGGHDVSSEMAALLTLVEAAGGGEIWLDLGTYGQSAPIVVPSGIRVIGKGEGQYPPPAYIADSDFLAMGRTRWLALAGFPAGEWMWDISTPADANYCNQDIALHGMAIDCNEVADYGLKAYSIKHCRVDGIIVFRPKIEGIRIGCNAVAPAKTNADTQFNQFGVGKGVMVWGGNTGSADGIVVDGTVTANTNQNFWGLLKSVTNTGRGIYLKNCDNEIFAALHAYQFNASGKGIVIGGGGGDPAQAARNNVIVRAEAGGVSGVIVAETGSRYNKILSRSTTNGTIGVVVEPEAILFDHSDQQSNTWYLGSAVEGWGSSKSWAVNDRFARLALFGRVDGQTAGKTDLVAVEGYHRGTAGSERGELRIRTRTAAGTEVSPLVVDGDMLTIGDGGTSFRRLLTQPQQIDLPSIAAGGTHSFTITVTGCSAGDSVHLGVPVLFLASGLVIDKAGVTAANTVTVYVRNPTGGAIDLAAEFWRATVFDAA